MFEGVHKDRGAVIARSNTNNKYLCWIRTKTLVDGSWLIQEGNHFWKHLPKPVLSLEWKILAQRQFDDTLAPINLLMPSAVTTQDFNEPLGQIQASVNQIQTECVQKRDDAEKLKDVLLLHIRSLEQ
ncbi:putative glutamate carboxypeptidase 2 [Dorcoceras hygrometricum]|nr:putative glutamate carboxypeptidase 2 [Dorcoceras hygrometricum]